MTDIFPKDVREAVSKTGSDWLKASEFESAPILQMHKPIEKVTSNNPKYGANDKDWLVKNNLLEEGEVFRYHFKTKAGQERRFDSKSAPFFLGFSAAGDVGVGDWVRITRSGKTDETRYVVEKVNGPDAKSFVDQAIEEQKAEIEKDDIPF